MCSGIQCWSLHTAIGQAAVGQLNSEIHAELKADHQWYWYQKHLQDRQGGEADWRAGGAWARAITRRTSITYVPLLRADLQRMFLLKRRGANWWPKLGAPPTLFSSNICATLGRQFTPRTPFISFYAFDNTDLPKNWGSLVSGIVSVHFGSLACANELINPAKRLPQQ